MTGSSFYAEPSRLHGAKLADYAVERVEEFFRTEESLSEYERLVAGLEMGVARGILTSDEAELCLASYLQALQSGERS